MNEKKGPNSFLIGLILGGAIGALISTKRGRQILKDIVDYGIEYVENTLNIDDIENILNEDEEEMFADELDMTKAEKEHIEKQAPKETSSKAQAEQPRRRLFRGIRRK